LVLDLEERVVEDFLESLQLPTKLTISYQGPGGSKEPGMPGFTDGRSRSRTCNFPTAAFEGLVPGDARGIANLLSAPVASPQSPSRTATHLHPVYGTAFLSPATTGVSSRRDGAEVLHDDRYRKRVTSLLKPIAELIHVWSMEERSPMPAAHMTITAKGMVARRSAAHQPAVGYKRLGASQSTLEQAFRRPQKRPCSTLPSDAAACIAISDSE